MEPAAAGYHPSDRRVEKKSQNDKRNVKFIYQLARVRATVSSELKLQLKYITNSQFNLTYNIYLIICKPVPGN